MDRHASASADSAQSGSFSLMRQVLLSSAVTAPLLAVAAGAFAEEGSVAKAAADLSASSVSKADADVSASLNDIQQSLQDGANKVIEGATPVPPLATGLIVFSPLILYGIFVTYRAKLNPRATLTDFAFIVAAVIIVLNLLSILVFKIRLF